MIERPHSSHIDQVTHIVSELISTTRRTRLTETRKSVVPEPSRPESPSVLVQRTQWLKLLCQVALTAVALMIRNHTVNTVLADQIVAKCSNNFLEFSRRTAPVSPLHLRKGHVDHK